MSQALRRPPTHRVEWEFDKVTFSREFPRTVVTKLLVERAEHGGWELDRVRITADGTRRGVLRRKTTGALGPPCPELVLLAVWSPTAVPRRRLLRLVTKPQAREP